ncbi:YesL family protein [Paenibacillus sp. GCM10023252]|uniref:YesL family protein n=1 Tax=Paenibacillus sp. GCM10023252 TaxID=3252649 RepID=UPI00361FEDC5
MEMRGMMGGFYRISEWIMRLSVTNVLWIICSIPFWFFSIVLLQASTPGEVYAAFLPMAIVAPFTLFPATGAMYTVARKWVMGEVDVPLLKTFFRGYKENYKQSMLGGILYTILIGILAVDFYVYQKEINLLSYVFIALIALLFVSMFNYFSMMVHYHMKTLQLLKNAILLTIGKPFRSISAAIMAGAVVFFSTRFTFLIPFFMMAVIAYLTFWNFYMIYQKLQEQAERAKQEADNAESSEDLEMLDTEGSSNK